jgi:two-component system chemotaxis response regulator CheB
MEHLHSIGKPSTFVCPDCQGCLWELDGTRPVRYRCYTGHAFSLRSLQHAQAEKADDALAAAIRALEEQRLLLERMAADPGQPADTPRLRAAAEEAQQREAFAQFLRSRSGSGSGGGSRCAGEFACFKECTLDIESDGNYGAVSPGGTYRGAWQFDQTTWDSNSAASGRGDLVGVDPATAVPGDQDAIAHELYQRRGNQPWGGRC